MTNNTVITKDLINKKLHVTREFAAPLATVWKAWTDSALLDKWWAPKPWKAKTLVMDFTEGGQWQYAMISPDDEKHYSLAEFGAIVPLQSFAYTCNFCDEHGNINEDASAMRWQLNFYTSETGTKVEVELSFDSDAAMQKMIAMGFEGGFTMGLGNLDELLSEV